MPERDLANRVISCGGVAVILFFVAGRLSEVRNLPEWILVSAVLLCVLFFFLALGFPVQDARTSPGPNTPMHDDVFAGRFGQWMLKCTRYWQCVLRVGLPFIVLVGAVTYLEFRAKAGRSGARYLYIFPFEFIVDVCIMLFIPAVFWWLARRLAASSSKSTER